MDVSPVLVADLTGGKLQNHKKVAEGDPNPRETGSSEMLF
jgi:hypothetical protein